jgi:hypothetical protein
LVPVKEWCQVLANFMTTSELIPKRNNIFAVMVVEKLSPRLETIINTSVKFTWKLNNSNADSAEECFLKNIIWSNTKTQKEQDYGSSWIRNFRYKVSTVQINKVTVKKMTIEKALKRNNLKNKTFKASN